MSWLDRIEKIANERNAAVDKTHSGVSGRFFTVTVDAIPGHAWPDAHSMCESVFHGPGAATEVIMELAKRLECAGKAMPCLDPDCDFCQDNGLKWNGEMWKE